MNVLTEVAPTAPRAPGVYFFLGPDRELLYIGKAADLRRRLGDHARAVSRTSDLRRHILLDTVRTVRWELSPDEYEASAREADLIVMLKPAFNAAHAEQVRDHFLVVEHAPARSRFELSATTAPARGRARSYGTFPHLAKGAYSRVAKRTKSGYTALLRLLWVAGSSGRDVAIPRRISGASPPIKFHAPVAPAWQPLLHDFLSGRSARLVPELRRVATTADMPPFTRAALQRDADAARGFFEFGPLRIRQFRLRHALPPGAVCADVMADRLESELRGIVGDLRATSAENFEMVFGRHGARSGHLRERIRQELTRAASS